MSASLLLSVRSSLKWPLNCRLIAVRSEREGGPRAAWLVAL